MLEIQDAARIITESIDPQAKVIFGAIKDDKLKKNEIKVTVIATGFPEDGPSHSHRITHRAPLAREREPERVEEESEPVRGKIFNSLPTRKPEMERVEPTPAPAPTPLPKRDPKPVDQVDESDEDDWGAVPAFLRRSKLK